MVDAVIKTSDGRQQYGKTQCGFTLMEVLVALSIVAIALLAIYRMQSQTLFMDRRSRFDTVAVLLARQKLADLNSSGYADLIGDSGTFGSDYPGYTWQIRSEMVSSELIKEDGPTLKQITIDIEYGENENVFSLVTYRHGYE
jgi:general secretion pathway protein I